MSNPTEKAVVTVLINGEQYTIRSEASPEYTMECAEYLDRTIADIIRTGSIVEGHRAVILAALALTDQLFRARAELEAANDSANRKAEMLVANIERALT